MGEGIIKLFRVYCAVVRAWKRERKGEERSGECVRGGGEVLWRWLVVGIMEW